MAKYHKSEIIKRPIEKFGTNVKKTAWSSILESLSILALGILFIIWPDTMIQFIAYIIGAIFLVKGLIDIMVYFMDQKNAYSNLLLSGLIAACIGLAALVAGPNIADIFRIIIGIFLIYEALVRVSSAVKLYYAKINLWKFVAILAFIIMVLGIFVIANSAAAIIGWIMVVAGAISIISDAIFIKYVDKIMEVLTGPADKKK